MKKKSLVLVLTTGCMAFLSTALPATVWRNQGACYSYSGSNAQAAIYIGGDMQFANGVDAGNAPIAPSITIENSRVLLTGDLLNDVSKGNLGGNLFVSPSSGNNGVLEFNGTSLQQITTSGTDNTNIPSKLYNYIDFPNIEINNPNHVNLDAKLAAKTQDITLSSGWLILDSDIAKIGVDGGNEVDPTKESVLAHLLVEGNIDYKENTWSTKSANERGFIQVNLKIPGEDSQTVKSIVGLGIPFNGIHNDYFMFNTLLEPVAGYTNGDGFLANPPLIDPTTQMTAGKGYVVGIDLRGSDPKEYGALEDYEGIIDFNQRAKEGYQFNRHAFASYAPKNQLFGNDPTTEAYTKEKLNTEDIIVTLKAGYNYLSNPYTCPLNIAKLLGNDEARATWDIQADALSAKPQMRNQVWVLNPNSKAELTGDSRYSRYTYNYYVIMKDGGTYNDNDDVDGVTPIAPLQMFLIRSYSTATTITIPKSERVMGTTRFLRSSPKENKRRDDFIIEFRDKQTNTSDRASIVLREQEELLNNKNYANVERLESTSVENSNGTRSGNAAENTTENVTIKNTTSTKPDFEQSLASQIYTKDNTGKPLTVQFLPVETEKVTLYHIPSSVAQPLHILGLRLNTKDKVTRMWLEDRKYNTETEITPETLYETYSEPTDSHERFVIRFSREAVGIDDELVQTSNIYAYSQDGTIYAQGFNNADFGSNVGLYDINGRLLANRTADSEKITLLENVTAGVYIVKVNTQKSKTIKIMAR